MLSNLDTPTKLIFWGNILLIVCCVFYLLWWVIAFHPTGGIRGFRSGWLLIPAAICGILAAVLAIRGGCDGSITMPYPRAAILIGGIAVYIILLIGTYLLLHRQVTTELFLIVAWVALMFLEMGALWGLGHFSTVTTVVLLVISIAVAVVSLICYLMYYDLDGMRGYIDGMIPLILIALMMVTCDVSIACST